VSDVAKLRVLRHMADDDKDTYKVEMEGDASDLINGVLVHCKVVLKAKSEEILQRFPRGRTLQLKLEDQPQV
jgi:hypothetical protein